MILLHELGRLFSRRPVLVTVILIVPLMLVAAFVQPRTPAVEQDITPAAVARAEAKLDELPGLFAGLIHEYPETNTYNLQLLDAWRDFGGQTDDIAGDQYGAYSHFYQAESQLIHEFFNAYNNARDKFLIYYDLFQKYMYPLPKVFIQKSDFEGLVRGTDALYELFDVTYLGANELNIARDKMNAVRQKTTFRYYLERTKPMFLYRDQFDDLGMKLKRLNDARLVQHASNTGDYIDHCEMTFQYITWHLNQYIVANATIPTNKFWGFTPYERQAAKREMVRMEYLFDRGEVSKDYSHSPLGVSALGSFNLMNAGYGTTIIDYVSNGVSIVFPALAIFMVFVTAFCVLSDINRGTIVGSVASPYSRRKIIWTKEVAVLVAAATLLLTYCLFFTVVGAILLGGMGVPPPVLGIAFGSLVIKTSAVGFLMFQCLVTLLKLFLIVSCVSLMSVAFKNKFTVCVVGVLFAAAFVVADVMLTPFSLYLLLIWPIKSLITGSFLFVMDRKFAKKEF